MSFSRKTAQGCQRLQCGRVQKDRTHSIQMQYMCWSILLTASPCYGPFLRKGWQERFIKESPTAGPVISFLTQWSLVWTSMAHAQLFPSSQTLFNKNLVSLCFSQFTSPKIRSDSHLISCHWSIVVCGSVRPRTMSSQSKRREKKLEREMFPAYINRYFLRYQFLSHSPNISKYVFCCEKSFRP